MARGACMFMICSNVAKRARDVKPQGNGVMRDRATPSLDVRDVEDEHSGCQNRGCPDESRIRGFVHDDSCTYKSCARTITAALTSVKMARKRSIAVSVHARRLAWRLDIPAAKKFRWAARTSGFQFQTSVSGAPDTCRQSPAAACAHRR